jgi:hypothetical protein
LVSPAVHGNSVTLTAVVTVIAPGAGVPTGVVTFKDGTTVLGTGTLQVVGGVTRATLRTTFAKVGRHLITAVYEDDLGFAGSTAPLTEKVS